MPAHRGGLGSGSVAACGSSSQIFDRRKPLRFGEIVEGVGVEEGIERLARPGHGRDAIAGDPVVNLAEAFDHEGLAQPVAQGDAPQSDHRVRSPSGRRDRKLRALSARALAQSRDQIPRQKRAIPWSAEHPLRARTVSRDPIKASENPGERPWVIRDTVGDDRQPERRKAEMIAIGVEKKALALRREPLDDADENRAPANFAQRLVAAAHPSRQTTRKHHARHA
jgi:hypothetical protein